MHTLFLSYAIAVNYLFTAQIRNLFCPRPNLSLLSYLRQDGVGHFAVHNKLVVSHIVEADVNYSGQRILMHW